MSKSIHFLDIEFNDNNILSSLFGVNDVNIHTLEKINNVKIEYRGNKVKILGSKKSITATKNELINLFEEAKKGVEIDEEKIKDTKSILNFSIDSELKMDLFIQTKKRKIIPRSENQKKYFELLNNKDIVLAIGPAGTGKTFIAVAKAVSLLQEGKIKKIILSRPAVEAGEKLGFLPGDLSQKIDPYLKPLYDGLFATLGFKETNNLIEGNIIEIAPLAFMRGRTLSNSFIILDEGQNTTREQMKMFLTRFGFGSKVIVTGDLTQVDLPSNSSSGLLHAIEVLKSVKEVGFIEFNSKDVVRNSLVQKIVEAYDKFRETKK